MIFIRFAPNKNTKMTEKPHKNTFARSDREGATTCLKGKPFHFPHWAMLIVNKNRSLKKEKHCLPYTAKRWFTRAETSKRCVEVPKLGLCSHIPTRRGRTRVQGKKPALRSNDSPKTPSFQTHSVATNVLSNENYKHKDHSLCYWGSTPYVIEDNCLHAHKEATNINYAFILHYFPFLLSYAAPPSRALWDTHAEIQETILQSRRYILQLFLQHNTNPQAFSESSLCQVQHQIHFRPQTRVKVTKQDTGTQKHLIYKPSGTTAS